jgi:release factor glutamine methyltransferase
VEQGAVQQTAVDQQAAVDHGALADQLAEQVAIAPRAAPLAERTPDMDQAALVDQAAAERGAGDQQAGGLARVGGLPRAVVVDLCCGSGAVGAALAAALGGVELHAADLDPAAVRCARRNLAAVGGHVYEGDLFEPLPAILRGRVDLLVANAPYVPTDAIPLLPSEARVHEPHIALDGGTDGLDIVRRLIAAAPRWLAPGGHLLVETSEQQAPHAVEAVTRAGLIPRVAASDDLVATVVIATAPPQRTDMLHNR